MAVTAGSDSRPRHKKVAETIPPVFGTAWGVLGLYSIVKAIGEGFYLPNDWRFPWIALAIEVALVACSVLVICRRGWAWWILLGLVLCCAYWAAEICIYHLWRGTFTQRFWLMFGVVGLAVLTWIGQLFRWLTYTET
jgi:hypothetical protein